MDKDLQVQVRRAGRRHRFYFIDVEFPGHDDPIDIHMVAHPFDCRGRSDIGQGGQIQLAPVTDPAHQVYHGQILQDDRVRFDTALQLLHQPAHFTQFARLYQRVDGNIDPGPLGVGQFGQGRQFFNGKVVGFHAGRELFQTAVNGIGPGRQARQE